jgi:hypothetical protein
MANNTEAMHGTSFAPVLRGESDRHRDVIVTGYHEGFERCVRDQTWSYLQRPPGEVDELYNLLEDPLEQNNRIDDFPAQALRLAGAIGSAFQSQVRTGADAASVKGHQGEYELSSGSVRVIKKKE